MPTLRNKGSKTITQKMPVSIKCQHNMQKLVKEFDDPDDENKAFSVCACSYATCMWPVLYTIKFCSVHKTNIISSL